jgi:transposase-like protein
LAEACFNTAMLKTKAVELLGGTISAVAAAVGVSPSAVSQWPDELPPRIEDRVLAALARRHLPAEMLGEPAADVQREAA